MMRILNLFKREMKIVLSDFSILAIIALAPIFFALFYSTVYYNKIEKNVPVTIVDNDHSETSEILIRYLDAHQMIEVKNESLDMHEAENKVRTEETQAIIYIPENFEKDLKSGLGTNLPIYLNTTRFLVSNDINKAVNEVAATMGAGIRLKYFESMGNSYEQSLNLFEPLRLDLRPLFNFTESYGDFLLPGLLLLILQQTLLIGLSESMGKEREDELLQDLFSRSGNNIFISIAGKGSFYLITYSIFTFLFFTVLFPFLSLKFAGSAFAAILLTLPYLIAVILFAIFIASFFKKKIYALQFMAFTSLPFFLISGYSWPNQSMPPFISAIGQIIPSTPYLKAMVRITQMGAGFEHVLPEFIHLIILLIAGLIICLFRMKQLKRIAFTQIQPSGAAEKK